MIHVVCGRDELLRFVVKNTWATLAVARFLDHSQTLGQKYQCGIEWGFTSFWVKRDAKCRGAIHCVREHRSSPQAGAMNCAPTFYFPNILLICMRVPDAIGALSHFSLTFINPESSEKFILTNLSLLAYNIKRTKVLITFYLSSAV